MDALILSCGTGGGHNAAGRAIEQELEARGHSVTFIDPYALRGPRTSSAINSAYISMVQVAPRAFGALYTVAEGVRKLPVKSPVYYVNRAMVSNMKAFLNERRFDVVVMPHLFPAEIITHLKRLGMHVPLSVFIATDYTCIPFTEETDCDIFVTPAPALTEDFVSRGIPVERIAPLGIPVRREFSSDIDRAEARERLHLDISKKIILVAGGSIGAGRLHETVGTLLEHFGGDAQIIVVCGNNRALYDKLRLEFGNKCGLIGQTSQMADYMRACDIFISKPGGLSSTEAANLGTALIHVTPIPGCETKNMRFFAENGMCIPVTNPKRELPDACDRLADEALRAQMAENQHTIIRTGAAGRICDLIESRLSCVSAAV